VALQDILDVDGYVSAAVRRAFPGIGSWEREELELEGVAALYRLASRWDGRGTFSGYAGSLLGKRLVDAWRRANPGARSADGPLRVVSLDALRASPGFSERQVRPMREFVRVLV
jgi:hypothetical protein